MCIVAAGKSSLSSAVFFWGGERAYVFASTLNFSIFVEREVSVTRIPIHSLPSYSYSNRYRMMRFLSVLSLLAAPFVVGLLLSSCNKTELKPASAPEQDV